MRHTLVTLLGRARGNPDTGYEQTVYRFPDGATRLHRDLWWHRASRMRPPEFTGGNQRRRDGRVGSLLLEDAFSGGPEAIRRLAQAARGHFIGATEVLVNVTGGTTLMGLAAEELAATARTPSTLPSPRSAESECW